MIQSASGGRLSHVSPHCTPDEMPGGRAFLNGWVVQDCLALRVMLTHQPESLHDSVEPAAGSHPTRFTHSKKAPLGRLSTLVGRAGLPRPGGPRPPGNADASA